MPIEPSATEDRLEASHQVFIDLVRTQSQQMRAVSSFLSRHGLTVSQYNVLRILRGAGKDGLRCGVISERMLTQVPDITRIVDGLANNDYVTREHSAEDRRVILIRISKKGLAFLEGIDHPILELHAEQFSNLTKSEIKELGRLLRKARIEWREP